eukprot:TRINITY_DN1368_c0_g1_i1.p1 TRINITY_DN1368_c0_g1~~TRINITY_DN1368_c0_g1_i1.p1  ORF type:complete len:231 (+),score=20.56 TRINITY_DN1368_c0_g1_i1:989-1681(+)
MWSIGLTGILSYSLEDFTDNKDCDANLHGFLKSVDTILQLPPGSVSFACVKITALCLWSFLIICRLLRWQHRYPFFNLPWKAERIPMLAPSSLTHHTQSEPEPLSREEEKSLAFTEQRLLDLCRTCEAVQLPLLVDAEYNSVQPAIDYLTYRAFSEFNKGNKPLVFGILQAYLKDALLRLIVPSTRLSGKEFLGPKAYPWSLYHEGKCEGSNFRQSSTCKPFYLSEPSFL